MPNATERQKVERWKLTPELLEIERAYRQRNQLTKIIEQGIVMETEKLNVMTNALFKLDKQKDALLQMVPPQRQDIEGTPMPDPDFNINY